MRFEDEVRRGRNVVDAAAAAGAEHLVYASVAGADRATGAAAFDSKREIEQYIRRSGMPATILRPVSFMDNYADPAFRIQTGALVTPLALSVPEQMIALADIGAFVAIAGDELTPPQTAQALSQATGQHIRHVQIPVEAVRQHNSDLADAVSYLNSHGRRRTRPLSPAHRHRRRHRRPRPAHPPVRPGRYPRPPGHHRGRPALRPGGRPDRRPDDARGPFQDHWAAAGGRGSRAADQRPRQHHLHLWHRRLPARTRRALATTVNGALDAMVRALPLELAPVRVNAVSPGWMGAAAWDKIATPEVKQERLAGMAARLPGADRNARRHRRRDQLPDHRHPHYRNRAARRRRAAARVTKRQPIRASRTSRKARGAPSEAAAPGTSLCGLTARQRQAAGPTRSPDRRLRGGCVAAQCGHTGDASANEEADRGSVGVAGLCGTTSTRSPAVRERSAPGFRCLPAAGIGRIPAITHGRTQRGSQVLAAPGQQLPASGGTRSAAASREPRS